VTEAPVDACAVAHGDAPADPGTRTLVVVFANPVARYLLHFARDVGFRTVLVDPDPARHDGVENADEVRHDVPGSPDTDVVVADHHRAELGPVLRDALAVPTRWVGVIGSPRHTAPHIEALRDLGVGEADIARVHRPIGLNIGSRTPGEIAVATLAGLIADRNGRPGGFTFDATPRSG
jgi:xanthine/CO dehydrogenase XdhC/CoxF family maturation factor